MAKTGPEQVAGMAHLDKQGGQGWKLRGKREAEWKEIPATGGSVNSNNKGAGRRGQGLSPVRGQQDSKAGTTAGGAQRLGSTGLKTTRASEELFKDILGTP